MLRPVQFSGSRTSTCATKSVIFTITRSVVVRVLCVVLVSLWAMGFSAVQLSAFPTLQINALGNGFQVRGIDAAANTAEMIQLQSWRNWPHVKFVRNTMREAHAYLCADPKLSVSATIDGSHPKPATTIRLWQDELHESIKHEHQVSIPQVMRRKCGKS